MLTKREFNQLFAALGQQRGYNLGGEMYVSVEEALFTLSMLCEEQPVITRMLDGVVCLNWPEEAKNG